MLGTLERTGTDLLTFDVVTTFAERHWESHAKRCVETFRRYWQGFELATFTDADLEAGSDWLAAFKARHAHKPTTDYRMDACRFAHKVAAIQMAFYSGRSDSLIWMDADCVTHAPVSRKWLTDLVGRSDVAYLPRARKYSECGFMVFRRKEATERFIENLVEIYKSDELFTLAEWHDSWAFDEVRKRLGASIRYASLSGTANITAHPLINGPLGSRLDHCKGARKINGRSNQSDLKVNRPEAYWRG